MYTCTLLEGQKSLDVQNEGQRASYMYMYTYMDPVNVEQSNQHAV